MEKKIRVRFAPSPTGGLHLGGVRTVLYNYLFAKQNNGDFILRIEDTDQSRYVPGAEEYIQDCLKWTGLIPDESPAHGGKFGPYRQSERKHLYREYAELLISKGYAYLAFDTADELETMRNEYKTHDNPAPQYDHTLRMKMRNSLSMDQADVQKMVADKVPYVVRIKIPENESITFTDMIRGDVSFDSSLIDDKVLLKADGMPTYHLAVVVDDYLMQISHAFRGEEWLPSAPVHILLWEYLFGREHMPQWAHLPLILGPTGKLSKRDGAKYGFPVFAMNWTDPNTNELVEGFREKGFLPEAFINLLALLGWNDGSEQEVFTIEELIARFSIDRIHSGGARFDYEKAKWFNHEWIKKSPVASLRNEVKDILAGSGIQMSSDDYLDKVITLVKDRCSLLTDFIQQATFFFQTPASLDTAAVSPKWTEEKKDFFITFSKALEGTQSWDPIYLETLFKETAAQKNLKPGELQLPMRVMLVGGKFGPPVFEIAALLGREETIHRIQRALPLF